MNSTILIITILTVIFILLRTAWTINKISNLRRKGVNLTRKNSYYKLISTIFLNDLPL